jgi:nitrite reductase (NO-forming)
MTKRFRWALIILIGLIISFDISNISYAADEVAKLTTAPEVPPALNRAGGANVVVELETVEKIGQLSNPLNPKVTSVDYNFWTFNGTVPGPFIRVKVEDNVTFILKNSAGSKNSHSINIHAVTGQGGGANDTQTVAGGKTSFFWKALNPGIYIYQCATDHIPTHIGNGMYGLLLVEPAEGLPRVDREYYVVQGDYYPAGKMGSRGLQILSKEKLLNEKPEYVLFNAMSAGGKMEAKVGETVRIYVGNGGPNLTLAFHIIGEIFDTVYPEGAMGSAPNKNVQTTLIPPGGATIVEFKVEVPSNLILVDRAISRAIDKGSVAFLSVTGNENPQVFKPLKTEAAGGH